MHGSNQTSALFVLKKMSSHELDNWHETGSFLWRLRTQQGHAKQNSQIHAVDGDDYQCTVPDL